MGQKVHPYAFRIGTIRSWHSRWFSKRNYTETLQEDIKLRKFLETKLKNHGIAKLELHRSQDKLTVLLHTSKPGILIGRSGATIEQLKKDLMKITKSAIDVKVIEVRKPEKEASLIAENIAMQLEKRISYRRACKSAMKRAMELGVKGIKINIAGRLNGAEIARSESFKEGSIPLHTIRADIHYHYVTAQTTYGIIGVKVWVCLGEIFNYSEDNYLEKQVSHSSYGKSDRPDHRNNRRS